MSNRIRIEPHAYTWGWKVYIDDRQVYPTKIIITSDVDFDPPHPRIQLEFYADLLSTEKEHFEGAITLDNE